MHYHLHIIPRNPPKDNVKFLNWEIKPGDMKAIEKMANKIKDAI